MSALGYPIVTPKSPIMVIYAQGVDLTTIVSVGETALYLKRVGDAEEYAKYYPFDVVNNQLSFAFDSVLFNRDPGRFIGRLVYNGTEVQTIEFVAKTDPITLVGRVDV